MLPGQVWKMWYYRLQLWFPRPIWLLWYHKLIADRQFIKSVQKDGTTKQSGNSHSQDRYTGIWEQCGGSLSQFGKCGITKHSGGSLSQCEQCGIAKQSSCSLSVVLQSPVVVPLRQCGHYGGTEISLCLNKNQIPVTSFTELSMLICSF